MAPGGNLWDLNVPSRKYFKYFQGKAQKGANSFSSPSPQDDWVLSGSDSLRNKPPTTTGYYSDSREIRRQKNAGKRDFVLVKVTSLFLSILSPTILEEGIVLEEENLAELYQPMRGINLQVRLSGKAEILFQLNNQRKLFSIVLSPNLLVGSPCLHFLAICKHHTG